MVTDKTPTRSSASSSMSRRRLSSFSRWKGPSRLISRARTPPFRGAASIGAPRRARTTIAPFTAPASPKQSPGLARTAAIRSASSSSASASPAPSTTASRSRLHTAFLSARSRQSAAAFPASGSRTTRARAPRARRTSSTSRRARTTSTPSTRSRTTASASRRDSAPRRTASTTGATASRRPRRTKCARFSPRTRSRRRSVARGGPDRRELLRAQLLVERREVFRGERRRALLDLLQLALEDGDALDLVVPGPSLVREKRVVDVAEVLAQALFARDRAALGRRDDVLADRVRLRRERVELLPDRVARGQALRARGRERPSAVQAVHDVAHAPEERVRLHRGVVLGLAVRWREWRARVERDDERRFDDLRALREAHRVRAGQDARARGAARGGGRRRDARRLLLHGPQDAVDALALPRGRRVDDAARGVEDLELHPPERVARLLVIGDDGGGRRVRPRVRGVAFRPAARAERLLPHGAPRKERDVLLERLRREGAERREVVHDPDPAPVRRDDEVLLARLEREVADGDGREIAALELGPGLPRVERDPEPELGPEVEEAGPDGVLLDHVRPAADARRRAGDPLPRLPGVARRVDPRRHVAEGVPVERRVRGAVRVRSGLDPRDPARGRQARNVLHEVRPRRAAVARELEVAVVGPDPDRLRVARALRDRVDRRVHLGGGVVHRDSARLLLLLFFRVVRREVRRDPLPRLSAVLRHEEELSADVQLPLLEARHVDRRVPVPAQLLPVARLRLDVAPREGEAVH